MIEIKSEQDLIAAKENFSRNTYIKYTCNTCNNIFEKQLRACKSWPLVCNACSRQTVIPYNDSVIEVKDKKDFEYVIKSAHAHQKIKYNCELCGKGVIKSKSNIKTMLCRTCSLHKTNKEKYGVESIFNRPDIREHTVKSTRNPDIAIKRKQTCIEKYGVDNPHKVDTIKEKSKQTCISKYGVDNPAKIKENIIKAQQTCLEKYGVRSYSQTEEFFKKAYKKYKYNNEYFDSSWELAYWIYCNDHQIPIIRNTECFSYEYAGEIHKYYPDFKLDNVYIEIKGDQFFKEDGTMQNPFDHTKDALYEAKHQCGIKNNVIFLISSDLQPYIEYVQNKYGKNYLDQFLEEHK